MKESFTAFPELICIDATYKLLELGFPVYVMVCIDWFDYILTIDWFDGIQWSN